MTFIYSIIVVVAIFLIIINLPVFGRLPRGLRLDKIHQLQNYRDGAIQNLSITRMQAEGISFFTILKAFFFDSHPNKIPETALPSVQPDMNSTPDHHLPEIIWFGHSSYLIKINGLRVLVDPVFSKVPSPFSFVGSQAFKGTDFVEASAFENIDVLVITHDHYDHLDYKTIQKIAPKSKKIITSLGVGAHLERWGIAADKIDELCWNESRVLANGLKFTAVPARHFTGRKFKRNQTLWSAFILQTETYKLFLGGDSGYDTHFAAIGKEFGPLDLALLECGQYNLYWPYIHMFPEQTVQAAKDLNAKMLMPVHWGKFSLATHPWDEPINRVVEAAEKAGLPIVTPKLGETVILNKHLPTTQWWRSV